MDPLEDLFELIRSAIVEEPPITLREGGIIRDGYNEEADKLRAAKTEGKTWLAELEARDRAMEILKSIDMDCYAGERCMNLPYGVQKQLEIARAMVSGPRLLLLDEPAAALNPQERARHEPGDDHFRLHLRDGLREKDRRGRARGGSEK